MNIQIYPIIFKGISGNCYLLQSENKFILIDSGSKSKRKELENKLLTFGCNQENLSLVIITHGDFDHTGNCAYLKEKFRTKIGMHESDAGMVENGDMFWNRKSGSKIMKSLINKIFNITKFTPDIIINEQINLLDYGVEGKILNIPGHSKGSIGLLLSTGDFFCGDLFSNIKKPEKSAIIDDKTEYDESLNKIRSYNIIMVYPGHGTPFEYKELSL